MEEELSVKRSETVEDYVADDAWANDGGNLAAGDPAPPTIDAEAN